MKQFFRGVCILALVFVFPNSAGTTLENSTARVKVYRSGVPMIINEEADKTLEPLTANVVPAQNVVIKPIDNTGFEYSWDYPPGSTNATYVAALNTREVNNQYYYFMKSDFKVAPENYGTITGLKSGAPYRVAVRACFPNDPGAPVTTNDCDYSDTRIMDLVSDVNYDQTVTGSATRVYDIAKIRLNVWPKTPATSFPVRAYTTYNPLDNTKFPPDGKASVVITWIKPNGTTSLTTTNIPWNIQTKSFAEYQFQPANPGLYIVRINVKLDRGFQYTYKVPGTGIWTTKYYTSRDRRTRTRTRVWIPAQYKTTDTIRAARAFQING